MSFIHEVITLQIGNYSNYVGTHWWNTQEAAFSYDPTKPKSDVSNDVLFREGVNQQGHVTYTPRLVLVDHKNALRHLSRYGDLYSDFNPLPSTSAETGFSEQNVLWEPDRVSVVKDPPTKKPKYQEDLNKPNEAIDENDYDFRNTTTSWTDYMYTRHHPRSINLLSTVAEPSEEQPFDCFSNGMQVWADEYFEDSFGDRVRQYIEECNNCQGFQTLFDCTDGFSGLSIKCLEHLQDEYGKTSLTIPIFSPNQTNVNEAMADSLRVINTALTYSHLIEHSSMILPLSTMGNCWRKLAKPRKFSNFNYEESNLYESSAVLAAYLDTISMRFRLSEHISSCHLYDFCADLTNYGRKLTAAALALPFQMLAEQDLIDCLDQFEGNLFTQLSPNSEIGTDYVVQSVVVRGIPEQRLKSVRPQKVVERQSKMAAYRCGSVSEMFQLYFQCANHASLAHVTALEGGMPTRRQFPIELFDKRLNSSGFLREFESDTAASSANKINSIPLLASAQCSNDLENTIESLHREAKRINLARIPRFVESGFETDEYTEALEKLQSFKNNYEENLEL